MMTMHIQILSQGPVCPLAVSVRRFS